MGVLLKRIMVFRGFIRQLSLGFEVWGLEGVDIGSGLSWLQAFV